MRTNAMTIVTRAAIAVLTISLLLVTVPQAHADTPYVAERETKLTPEPLDEGDRFARALAIDEDHIALGNPYGGDGGQVFVYERTDTGAEIETVLETGEKDAGFGTSVDLDGDRLAVGAVSADAGETSLAGLVFVYEETSDGEWALIQTVAASEPERRNEFGASVDLESDRLAIGEPRDSQIPWRSDGAVHIFGSSDGSYVHEAKISAPTDSDTENLGTDVEWHQDTLLAAAPNDKGKFGNTGAVFVYEPSDQGWSLAQTVTPPTLDVEIRQFAYSFTLEDDTLVVGAPGDQFGEKSATDSPGIAFVYNRTADGWDHQATLDPALFDDTHGVGWSVALDGTTAYVAAPDAPAGPATSGLVAVFEAADATWTETGYVLPDDPATESKFGFLTAAHDGTLLVSDPRDDDAGPNAGAVYLFSRGHSTPSGSPADGTCTSPAGGIEACDTDDDPEPERVRITIEGDPGVEGTIVYEERTFSGTHLRTIDGHIEAPGAQPDRPTTVDLHASCWDFSEDDEPCNRGTSTAQASGWLAGRNLHHQTSTDCRGLSAGAGSLCTTAVLQAGAGLDKTTAQAHAVCGGGLFAECPDTLAAGAGLRSPLGAPGASLVLAGNAVAVCVHADQLPVTCITLPPR